MRTRMRFITCVRALRIVRQSLPLLFIASLTGRDDWSFPNERKFRRHPFHEHLRCSVARRYASLFTCSFFTSTLLAALAAGLFGCGCAFLTASLFGRLATLASLLGRLLC